MSEPMIEVEVLDHAGNETGRIWADSASVIKSDPPGLIALTRQFLEASPDLDARGVVETMRGYSNGYVVIR